MSQPPWILGNRTRVLCKSSKRSQVLSHFSSNHIHFFKLRKLHPIYFFHNRAPTPEVYSSWLKQKVFDKLHEALRMSSRTDRETGQDSRPATAPSCNTGTSRQSFRLHHSGPLGWTYDITSHTSYDGQVKSDFPFTESVYFFTFFQPYTF